LVDAGTRLGKKRPRGTLTSEAVVVSSLTRSVGVSETLVDTASKGGSTVFVRFFRASEASVGDLLPSSLTVSCVVLHTGDLLLDEENNESALLLEGSELCLLEESALLLEGGEYCLREESALLLEGGEYCLREESDRSWLEALRGDLPLEDLSFSVPCPRESLLLVEESEARSRLEPWTCERLGDTSGRGEETSGEERGGF
jgi:hypothetical protein